MKLIASSQSPTKVPFIHLGYTAARGDVEKVLAVCCSSSLLSLPLQQAALFGYPKAVSFQAPSASYLASAP